MFRIAASTLAGVIFLAGLSACSTKAERIESSLQRGNQFVHDNDWDKASVEARNVLQMDPKNAGAFLIVARVEDGKDNPRGAYNAYQKVLELQPTSVDARIGTARLYLAAGDFDHAATLIDGLLAQDPSNVRAQILHASLLMGRKDKAGALAEADRAAAANASLPADAAMTLAGLYYGAGEAAKAQDTVDHALQNNPKDLPLVKLGATMAALSTAPDSLQRADRLYAKATELAPRENKLWVEWSTIYLMKAKDVDHAESVLRAAVKADPDDGERQVALLKFLALHRDTQVAEQAWKKAIDDHPKNAELRLGLADFYQSQRRPDDTMKVLQAIVDQDKDKPAAITARGRMAELLLQRHQRDQALAMLNDLLKTNPRDGVGLLLRGQIERANGDSQAAIIDLRAALKDKPGDVQVAALLAGAHHQAGEPQLAREVLADVVKFDPKNPKAHLVLAADMMGTGEWSAAGSEIDAAIQAAPTDLEAYQKKVELHVRQNDFAGAEAVASGVAQQFPQSAGAQVLLARTLAIGDKVDPAVAAFDKAMALAPGNTDPVAEEIGLLIARHRTDEAGKRIDRLLKDHPDSQVGQELKGELALNTGDLATAEASFSTLVAVPDAPPSAYRNLALVKAQRHDVDGMVAVLKQAEQVYPNDDSLPATRAEWLARSGRVDEAIAVYDETIKRFPDSDLAANNLAYVLTELKRDPASLDRADKLAERFAHSTQPDYIDTLGLVQYRLGHYDQAVALLRQASELAPGKLSVQMHYGMALVKSGNVSQGEPLLRKALAAKPPLADHDEAQALISHA